MLALIRPATSSSLRSAASINGVRCITLKVVPKPEEIVEGHDERNMRLKRVLSPHMTIYQPQLTSLLSLTHRATGIALASYATAIGVGALALPHDFSHYITIVEGLQLGSASLITAKFVLAFPLAFHSCNGVRHLLWDAGKFMKIKEVYSTGYAMLGASTVLTAILALL